MKALAVEQSLPICCALAAIGGILEVAATAVTAVPAVRAKEGIALDWYLQAWSVAGNIGLQAIGSLLSHLIATWFGPVSLVVPFFYSATLLSNMLIFGCLGEHLTKNMRVGTHIIVVAVILLPVVGPSIQDHQDIGALMSHWYSVAWFVLLLVACTVTGILLVLDITRYSMNARILILLIARAASISVNLTVSRSFILGPNQAVLIGLIIIKLVSGAIYTYAVVVQSYAVQQARFVPLNATLIILVNALTGVIIWEDWRGIQSVYGYLCVFVLLGLGCDLLLSVPNLLNAENPDFGTSQRTSMIFRKRASSATLDAAAFAISNQHERYQYDEIPDSSQRTTESQTQRRLSRVDAWKEIVSPSHSHHQQHSPNHKMFFSPELKEESNSDNDNDGDDTDQVLHNTGTYHWFQMFTPLRSS